MHSYLIICALLFQLAFTGSAYGVQITSSQRVLGQFDLSTDWRYTIYPPPYDGVQIDLRFNLNDLLDPTDVFFLKVYDNLGNSILQPDTLRFTHIGPTTGIGLSVSTTKFDGRGTFSIEKIVGSFDLKLDDSTVIGFSSSNGGFPIVVATLSVLAVPEPPIALYLLLGIAALFSPHACRYNKTPIVRS